MRERWCLLGLTALSLAYVAWSLPLAALLQRAQAQVQQSGPWGALLFIALYVVAGLCFVPGSALTLAAGALFGLLQGMLVVSLASTSVAALAFLIARYLARDWVQGLEAGNRYLGALNRSIAQQGWKAVALLRLSPAFPFSLGNYLYGLTPVDFGPYLLSSWLAMLPGTFLYVYIGYLGARTGAVSGPRWALLAIGIAATAWVTTLVARSARTALEEWTPAEAPTPSRPLKLRLVAALAILAAAVVGYLR